MPERGAEPLERKTISLPKSIYAAALKNAARRGFATSFSAYIAWLVQRDEEGDVQRETLLIDKPPIYGAHLRVAEGEKTPTKK